MQKIRYISMAEEEMPASASAQLLAEEECVADGTETLSKRHYVKLNESYFVNEIKKRPILYNVLHTDYKKITARNEAWSEVAELMNLSIQECKKRWRSMRDAFHKTLRNKGVEERKTWIHYRLLEFLLPYSRNAQLKGQQENNIDFDFLSLDDDLDMYGDGPITVSYVTADGKELFQVLHRPTDSELLENDGAEDEEKEELLEIGSEGHLTSLLRPHGPTVTESQHMSQEHIVEQQDEDYLETSEPEEASDYESLLYEERLDSTMLDFCDEPKPANGMDTIWKTNIERSSRPPIEASYESPDETHARRSVLNPFRKRRKMESANLHNSKKLTDDEYCPPYKVAEPAPVPLTASPPPASAAVPSSPPREEEPRRERSKDMDARLGITDPDERFLMSCAPILRRLPNKKNLLARLRIQQMLYELEYDEKYAGT